MQCRDCRLVSSKLHRRALEFMICWRSLIRTAQNYEVATNTFDEEMAVAGQYATATFPNYVFVTL